MVRLPKRFHSRLTMLNAVQNPEFISDLGLASSDFARHYFRNLGWFLFLALLRCFSSGGSLGIPIDSVYRDRITSIGLLHSEICGSKLACNSPQLFAAYHVLLRLPMPRHPPCALISLTFLVELCLILAWSFHFEIVVSSSLNITNHLNSLHSLKIFETNFSLLFFIQFSRSVREISLSWWAQMDSNHRPHAYQACALTTWAMRPS